MPGGRARHHRGFGNIQYGGSRQDDWYSGALHRNTNSWYGCPNQVRSVQVGTGAEMEQYHTYAAKWTASECAGTSTTACSAAVRRSTLRTSRCTSSSTTGTQLGGREHAHVHLTRSERVGGLGPGLAAVDHDAEYARPSSRSSGRRRSSSRSITASASATARRQHLPASSAPRAARARPGALNRVWIASGPTESATRRVEATSTRQPAFCSRSRTQTAPLIISTRRSRCPRATRTTPRGDPPKHRLFETGPTSRRTGRAALHDLQSVSVTAARPAPSPPTRPACPGCSRWACSRPPNSCSSCRGGGASAGWSNRTR